MISVTEKNLIWGKKCDDTQENGEGVTILSGMKPHFPGFRAVLEFCLLLEMGVCVTILHAVLL